MASQPEAAPGPRARPLFSRLGEAVVQVAASAGELLLDENLRRKAGHLVVSEAGKRITDLRDGVATRAGNLQQGLNRTGPGLYARIQKQYLASRHEASLRARRDTPVDVQVGPFLWEDAPQELRSRLWVALLAHPRLVSNLIQERALEAELLRCGEAGWQARASPHDAASLASGASTPVAPRREPAPARASSSSSSSGSGEAPPAQNGRGGAAGAAADAPAAPSSAGRGEAGTERPEAGCPDTAAGAAPHSPGCAQQQRPEREAGAGPPPEPPTGHSGAAAGGAGASPGDAAEPQPRPEPQPEQQPEPERGREPGPEQPASSGGQEDAWEIVQDASSLADFRGSQLPAARLQPGERGAAMTFRERLLEAVCAVAWPISTVYPEGCLYDTLCQISVGQEEVEEVIQRDINRTFPEHPQFSFEQGQQELFRVLKAYSLHDLQVGYCQGMAFVTGVLLMYVPEEPAFRLLARLMDESGANLRQLYLPGLEGLKAYLRMFEWLLDAALPQLRAHLEAHGVVPVLYASQWFLTAFSCPFPPAFACRVVDVMLTERCGHVMLRVGLAVMRACEAALLALHDFEDLVTHLKVEPVRWSAAAARAVLNEAVEGGVSEAALAAAAAAVAGGYDGSLSRRPSTLGREAAAAAPPAAAQRQGSSLGPAGSGPQAPEPTPRTSGGADGGSPGAAAAAAGGDGIDSAELRLALDALWVGEDGEAGAEAL